MPFKLGYKQEHFGELATGFFGGIAKYSVVVATGLVTKITGKDFDYDNVDKVGNVARIASAPLAYLTGAAISKAYDEGKKYYKESKHQDTHNQENVENVASNKATVEEAIREPRKKSFAAQNGSERTSSGSEESSWRQRGEKGKRTAANNSIGIG
jgi:hypothetical protein